MLNVIKVVLYSLRQVTIATQIVDLRPAGDAGLHQMLLHVARNAASELGDKVGPFRPWTHQRHFAAKYVDQLRQLVQAESAQKRPKRCRALFPSTCPHRSTLLFGVNWHRPELEHH